MVTPRRSETIIPAGGLAFTQSGQLSLKEYYTLVVIGKGGVGHAAYGMEKQPCTATAAAVLKESWCGCECAEQF